MRPRLGIALVLVVCLSTSLPAGADMRTVTDDNDTKGRLDIISASHDHRATEAGKQFLVHRIEMHDPWRSRLLTNNRRQAVYVQILFDTRQDVGYDDYSGVTEREVIVMYRRKKLRAILYNHLGDPPKRLARLPIQRTGENGFEILITKRQLKKGELSYYEWGVQTVFSKKGHEHCPPRKTCFDQAPDKKYQRHNL